MYATERRQQIVARARRDGRVVVSDLSAELGVAQETVRRDLVELERQGLINRTHGGGLPADRISFEGTVITRSDRNPEEKQRIAHRAVAEIGEAEVIYLDEGSTAAALAETLDLDRPLTVITPSMPAAAALLPRPQFLVILLGGALRPHSRATSGSWPARMLAELVIDIAFVGTNGISRKFGLTCPDISVATVKRAALSRSRRAVLLTDSSKFGRDSFATFGQISDMHTIITGTSAPRSFITTIRAMGVQVVQA